MKHQLSFSLALLITTTAAVPSVTFAQDATTVVAPKVDDATITAAIDKGLAFLKSRQLEDGGWATDKQPPAITALVLKPFAQDPKTGPQADFVRKGFDRLLSFQVENGGIYKDAIANYNTAISVSALAAANSPEYKPAIDKAVAYLRGLQWTSGVVGPKGESVADADRAMWEGGWGYGGSARPDMSNTQMAVDALHDAGLKPEDPAYQKALAFLTRSQNRSESNDQPFSGNDGGFFYTPARGGESMAGHLDLADKKEPRSYGSMTYAGLKSFIYAGLNKTDPRVTAAYDWIKKSYTLDENPGMGAADPEKAKHGLYYYYLTMAKALTAYGEPTIVDAKGVSHDWRAELSAKLISLQQADGSWVGDKRWMEDNPVITTSYVVAALQELGKK